MKPAITYLILILLLPLSIVRAQNGSWTNQAGHVLSAFPVELKGTEVSFKKGTNSVTYPLTAFLPAEQKRLKDALGIVEVPAGLRDAQALTQRVLKRLQVLYEAGRMSDAAYRDECATARQSFRDQAAPFVQKGAISLHDLSKITP